MLGFRHKEGSEGDASGCRVQGELLDQRNTGKDEHCSRNASLLLDQKIQCSVCLGDYQSDERLQRIPSCGHTFHIDCIDHWLATHTTCPLCRVSLLPAAKPTADQLEDQASEGQPQEQSPESLAAVRIGQQENEAGERERVRGTVGLDDAGEVEEIRSYGEGSVVINVEGHSNTEENLRV